MVVEDELLVDRGRHPVVAQNLLDQLPLAPAGVAEEQAEGDRGPGRQLDRKSVV